MSPPKDAPLAVASLLNQPLTVEPDNGATDDTASDDPGYDSESASSSSVSISSSIRVPCWVGSRRYHTFKHGRYFLPDDPQEQDVEEMKHCAALQILGGRLHLSPLRYPQSIMDIGTGTGLWAIEVSNRYTSAEVVGIDLSPIQPCWTPPNTKFYIDDVESMWVEPPGSVDLVFLRNMALGIRDWPALLYQAYEVLKPGGWIEIQDFHWAVACDDDSMPANWAPTRMAGLIDHVFARYGINPYISRHLPALLSQAGFTTMEPVARSVPVGPWHPDPFLKDLGLQMREILLDGVHGLAFFPLHRGAGWNSENVDMFMLQVREELMDPSVHSRVSFHCHYAQKPLCMMPPHDVPEMPHR